MLSNGLSARAASLDSTSGAASAATTQAPPPPPPKDASPQRSVSSRAGSTTSPSRIKRKPLPLTAFSPHSVVSSPHSIYSHYDEESRSIDIPSSADVLHDILDYPLPQTDPKQTFYSEATPTSEHFPAFAGPESLPAGVPLVHPPQPPPKDLPRIPSANEGADTYLEPEVQMAGKSNAKLPPLRVDPVQAVKSLDTKKPQSPGSVFTSFFGRRQNSFPKQNASPSVESATTDISEGRSPAPSPYPASSDDNSYFSQNPHFITNGSRHASPQSSQDSTNYDVSRYRGAGTPGIPNDLLSRFNMLEVELQEISRELAGSIRRELDLEDLVDRLQSENPYPISTDRTSDYFSDSGTSSSRNQDSMMSTKEEIEKIRREADQHRAQLRMELSQKWQEEISQRKLVESHISILEGKLQQTRRDTNESSDTSAKVRELEAALDDARRRLTEERQTKENFEDLLTALKVDLEQHRNERDNLKDEIVPKLRSQIEGLEANLFDNQKQPYDYARMQQELQHLRDENAALSSARKMEQDLMRGMGQIGEDDDLSTVRSSLILPKTGGLGRSNTRGSARNSLSRSGSVSKHHSSLNRPLPETPDAVTDKLNAVEQQRDALHSTAKHLRHRLELESRRYTKQIAQLQAELDKANEVAEQKHRGGYEREVRTLRKEINSLRRRADDALDQKWQCEKGLSGLKMDLDRSKQETASLQKLINARDSDDPERMSGALQRAIDELDSLRQQGRESMGSLRAEQRIATQLEESAERSEALAKQVREQLSANSGLRVRLMNAVEKGEKNQQTSADQINGLQSKLKKLEDTITTAQIQSETAVMKHEEEIHNLKSSHNAQLQRARAGIKSPSSAKSPLSPLFANSRRSPRLEQTSSGPGQSLNEMLKTEFLQHKVSELERALSDADHGMEEVVGRMNQAQIDVFELQQERDEALKRTRQLEKDIRHERERFEMLITGGVGIES